MCSAISSIIQSLSRTSATAAAPSNEYKALLLITPGAAAAAGGRGGGAFQFNVSVAACMILILKP